MEEDNKEPLKYPILFLHGFGFRDNKKISYWGRIPKIFTQRGCSVHFGGQDSSGSIQANAEYLKDKIGEILNETGAEKVNVIAHSKGGLEARYLISTLGMGDKIASLTTIGTPHHGSKTLDIVPEFILKIVAFFTNVWMRIVGDKHPDAYNSFLSFRASDANLFNQNNPDSDKVYYQSYAFAMKRDIFLWFPHIIISVFEGENDGLVTTASAQWANFKGVIRSNSGRGISHCDEVDLRRRRFTKKTGEGVSDILEIYSRIADDLFDLGF